MYMFEVCIFLSTDLEAPKIRKLSTFTFISPIMGHPVLSPDEIGNNIVFNYLLYDNGF